MRSNEDRVFYKDLGQKIHENRVLFGIIQKELANEIGVSEQQLSKYERGSNRIPVLAFLNIANRLGLDLKELIPEYSQIVEVDTSESTNLVRLMAADLFKLDRKKLAVVRELVAALAEAGVPRDE